MENIAGRTDMDRLAQTVGRLFPWLPGMEEQIAHELIERILVKGSGQDPIRDVDPAILELSVQRFVAELAQALRFYRQAEDAAGPSN